MSSYSIISPYQYFADSDGSALDSGYIYIGAENLNPETNPIQLYWDKSLSIPAAQPVRTSSGYPVRNGTPAEVFFAGGAYSITVRDKNRALLFYSASTTPGDEALREDLAEDAPGKGAAIISGAIKVVDSVAELRLLLKTSNSKDAFVTGYYSALDGVDAHYHLDAADTTTADNGGTVIVAADGGRWKLVHSGTVSIRQFGAKGDGTTNDYAAIQAAIDSGVPRIYVPAGEYKCLSTINLCNLAATGRGITIFGDTATYDLGGLETASVIRSNPGAGKWIAEIVGSQFVVIEDIKFLATGASAASYGLLYARSTVAGFAQNNSLRRVVVKLDTASGSIALGNNCAEQFVCDECWLEADIPYVTTLANEQGFVSQYATIANTVFSNTAQSFRLTTFTPLTSTGMILTGLGTANFDNCVVIPAAGNTYQYGVTMRSSLQAYQDCQNVTFTGQIESWVNAVRLEGNTRDLKLNFSTSNVTGAHVLPLAGTVHYSPDIRTNPFNTTGVNVVQASAASATIYGGQIVIAPNLTLVDSNLKLLGTDVDGGNAALNNPAVFAVKSDSSYHPRWSNSAIYGARIWTPGEVPIGGSVAVTFTLTGAAVGDMVDVAWPFGSQSCILQGAVDSANTVRLTISNVTGGIVTFASVGTFKTIVSRPTF